ncbi:hypothetical protein EDB81DRAFT_352928 [Dactylonectria macrodidyma]|uniref:Fucose-specific lectin n=1 Tax=Dactylonectria macrodidyma TaxID=307937 RepID=A0A9P9FHI3_9HYPO|nr:hypothetical protein EDB81DRAFT_352928 [Dactylonectria macrodidyma]
MSCAAIWNPLSGSGGAKSKLLIFSTSPKLNLVLRQWTASGAEASWGERTGSSNIRKDSDLAVAQLQDMIRVFGVIKPNGQVEGDKSYISNLSPIEQSLNIETVSGSLAVSTDGDEQGWLYYLCDSPSGIYECSVGQEKSKPALIDATGAGLLNHQDARTHLAACYVASTGSRYIVYQTDLGRIRVYDIGKKSGMTINMSITAKTCTPLAAASYLNDNDQAVIIIYFIDNATGAIMKAWRGGEGAWETNSVINTSAPSGIAALSVAVSEREKHNVIVYSTSADSKDIKVQVDPWA